MSDTPGPGYSIGEWGELRVNLSALDSPTAIPARRIRQLTFRQRECLRLTALGFLNKQAAYEMGVAEQTVKNHLHQAYLKLGVFEKLGAFRALGWLVVPDE